MGAHRVARRINGGMCFATGASSLVRQGLNSIKGDDSSLFSLSLRRVSDEVGPLDITSRHRSVLYLISYLYYIPSKSKVFLSLGQRAR